MLLRLPLALLIALLALTGCATGATIAPATPRPATSVPTPVPTNAPQTNESTPLSSNLEARSTLQPTVSPIPLPTATRRATVAPAATVVPTRLPIISSPVPVVRFGEELLFLRGNSVWAHDIRTRAERKIADDTTDFLPAPGGALIAILRGSGLTSEIWLVGRDGSALHQVTRNDRAEATLSWSPDGRTLIYGSSASQELYANEWITWSHWCAEAEIRALDLNSGNETSLAPGCDPAISPDGRRIAYVAPPTQIAPGYDAAGPLVGNSIRLINRLGQNGWNFAKAQAQGSTGDGLVVYGPSWSPDGQHVVYHRYLGMQVEVDINLTEMGASFVGKGQSVADGAGWLLPTRFSPDSRIIAAIENDVGNARGLVGYGAWKVQLVRLEGTREIILPDGARTVIGQALYSLPGGQDVVWSPNGSLLAVQLPAGWKPESDPEAWGQAAGEIWRWVPGKAPNERLVVNVNFGSKLAWLPAT